MAAIARAAAGPPAESEPPSQAAPSSASPPPARPLPPRPAPVCAADFEAARAAVGPSVGRGTAREFPPASWDDVGGLEGVKQRLRQAVEWPLAHADAFQRMGLVSAGRQGSPCGMWGF